MEGVLALLSLFYVRLIMIWEKEFNFTPGFELLEFVPATPGHVPQTPFQKPSPFAMPTPPSTELKLCVLQITS